MNSSGTKLIDKLMSHLDDELIDQLEGHLVGQAPRILNVPQMCSHLVQWNLLDEDDFQVKTTTKAQRRQWAGKAINAACSKKAIGSLVIALERSGNWRMLEETLEFLEALPQRKTNRPVAPKRPVGQSSKEKPKATNPTAVDQVIPSEGMKQIATLNFQPESVIKGTFAFELDQCQMTTRLTDGTVKLWNWREDEQKTIKLGVQVTNITWFQCDEEIIVAGTSDGRVYLFELETLEEKCSISLDGAVHSLKFVESSLVVVTREADNERFWWVDISRPEMRLLNYRMVESGRNTKKAFFFVESNYTFLYVSGLVWIYSTKLGERIQERNGSEWFLYVIETMSTCNVVDFITTKVNFVAGYNSGDIEIWDSRDFMAPQNKFFSGGHLGAVVSLCSVHGHLLSLDDKGYLLMWSGYDLEDKNIKGPLSRVLAEDVCNVAGLVSYGRWFATIPRMFEKDSRNVESWYKRWFGFSSPKAQLERNQCPNVNVWTLPDLWLRTG